MKRKTKKLKEIGEIKREKEFEKQRCPMCGKEVGQKKLCPHCGMCPECCTCGQEET